jgi:hypothetical protein
MTTQTLRFYNNGRLFAQFIGQQPTRTIYRLGKITATHTQLGTQRKAQLFGFSNNIGVNVHGLHTRTAIHQHQWA